MLRKLLLGKNTQPPLSPPIMTSNSRYCDLINNARNYQNIEALIEGSFPDSWNNLHLDHGTFAIYPHSNASVLLIGSYEFQKAHIYDNQTRTFTSYVKQSSDIDVGILGYEMFTRINRPRSILLSDGSLFVDRSVLEFGEGFQKYLETLQAANFREIITKLS